MTDSCLRAFAASSMIVLFALAGGCGKDPYRAVPVTGTVFCDGKPATGGTIVFQPLDAPAKTGRKKGETGPTSSGVVDEDGTFTLVVEARGSDSARDGAILGPHAVRFLPPRTEPWKIDPKDESLPAADLAALKEEIENRPVYEPLDCGRGIAPETVEVVSGTNMFEFTLRPRTPGSAPERVRKREYAR